MTLTLLNVYFRREQSGHLPQKKLSFRIRKHVSPHKIRTIPTRRISPVLNHLIRWCYLAGQVHSAKAGGFGRKETNSGIGSDLIPCFFFRVIIWAWIWPRSLKPFRKHCCTSMVNAVNCISWNETLSVSQFYDLNQNTYNTFYFPIKSQMRILKNLKEKGLSMVILHCCI